MPLLFQLKEETKLLQTFLSPAALRPLHRGRPRERPLRRAPHSLLPRAPSRPRRAPRRPAPAAARPRSRCSAACGECGASPTSSWAAAPGAPRAGVTAREQREQRATFAWPKALPGARCASATAAAAVPGGSARAGSSPAGSGARARPPPLTSHPAAAGSRCSSGLVRSSVRQSVSP